MNTSASKYSIRFIVVISLLITNVYTVFAQCPVTAFASSATINCGDTVVLSAVAGGCTPLNNNFNSGNIGTDWSASPGGVVTDGTGTYACAGPPPEGSNYLWMGATVAAPRGVITNNYDLTDCGAIGATICFDMKYSTQAGPDPCEGIDLPAEGVSVQYSTNGGATWTTIQYYDPNGGYDPMLTSWNRYCLAVPAAALTTSTMFRWYQSQSSGAGFDTWGLDDMVITLTVPGYAYDWAHDVQGVQPTPATPNVAPTTTTTYTVTYTNGVETCSSPVTVNVLLPTVTTTASPTTFCSGASSQLVASSSLIPIIPTSCGINTYVGCPPNSQAGEPQIGNGATVATYNSSANYVFGDFGSTGGVRTQIIYRASELIAAGFSAGQITNMQLEVAAIQTGSSTTTGSAIYNNFTIQLACIAANQFSSSSNWQSGLTTVFPATNVNVTPGWNTFNFPNSYNWDGTSNIVVQLCWYNGSAGGNPAKTKTQASGFNSMIASYVNASGAALNCASHTSFQTLYTFRPNTRFGTCTPKNLPLIYSWTPTTGLSNPNIYNPVASPTSTTTYTVTVQQSGAPAACNATSNVTVNVVAPTVSISNICSGGVATLTANGTTNGTVPSGTITNSNTSAQANYNVNTYVEKCIDVSNINPNTYPAGLANVFVNITHCDIAEVDLQIMGPGGVWTTLTALTSGGKTWTTLPAGAATSINGQWCIRYKDNCVGCGIAGIDDCGGLNFNSWSITLNNAAGSNQIVQYTWSPATDLNQTTGPVVQSTSTSPTTYTVTVKDAFGCSANQMITVDASNCIQPPTASFTTSSNTICIGNSITFTDNSTGVNVNSWNWTFNGGTPNTANTQGAHTVTFNTAGTFNIILQVTDDNGTDDTTMTITVNPQPTVNAGADQTVCENTSVTLTGSGATSYVWDNGVSNGVAFTPTATNTYTVTGTDGNGCSNTDQVTVTVNPNPTVNAGADQAVCSGTSVTLSGSGATSYVWDNGVSNGVSFTPTATNTYTVTGTDGNGCSNTDQVTVTVNPQPTVNAGTDQAVCENTSVTLTGSGATSYVWDNGVSNGVAFTPTSTTTYTVTGTDANGCSNTDQVVVMVNPQPTVNAGADQAVCENTSVTLTGSGATSYTWDNGVSNGVAFTPTSTTTYTVTGTDGNGCSNTDQVVVTVNPQPTVNAGADQAVCENTSVTLTGSGATSYVWDNGVSNGVAFTPTSTTTYTVTGTDANGCSNTDQVTVTVNPQPTVNAGADQAVCSGTSVTLSGSGATSYVWDNGVSDGVAFTPTSTTIYTVTGTDGNGCSNTDAVTVTVNNCSQPTASFTTSSNTICIGNSITFTDNSTGVNVNSWNWTFNGGTPNTANTQGVHTVIFNAAGTFNITLQVTDDNGTDDTTMTITVNPNPTVNAGTDQAVCENTSVTLTGSGATSYVWDNGVSDGVAFTPTATNTYTVTGTDGNGCSNTDQVTVTVNPNPTVNAGADQTVCENTSVTLTGSGATSYVWDNGVSNGVSFTPTATNTYTVTGTDGNGCSNTDQVTVTVNNCTQPTASFTTSSNTICIGNSITFTDNSTGVNVNSWNWTFNGGAPNIANTQGPHTITFNTAGTFNIILQVTDDNGTDDTTMTITVNPNPTVNAGVDQTVCENTSVILTGSGATSYVWDNGVSNGVAFTPTATNTYTVTGTDANGCSNIDAVTVTVNNCSQPTASFTTSSNTICIGNSITFTDNSTGVNVNSWNWTFNGGTPNTVNTQGAHTITFNTAGTFNITLQVTDDNGTDDTTMTITVNPNPTVNAGVDQAVCSGTSVTLSGSGATSYVWDNGVSNGVAFTPTATNTYTVTGTDANGCSNTDAVIVTINPNPSVNAGADQSVCEGTSVTLSGSGATNYIWDNGVTDGTAFTPTSTTTYTVTGTDGNGCSNTDAVTVTVNNCTQPQPNASFIASSTTVCVGENITFTDNSTGVNINSWNWTFNGGTPNIANTQGAHTVMFNTSGTFNITLQVVDDNGTDDTTMVINVISLPIADFAHAPSEVDDDFNSEITFTDNSVVATDWYWNFGDGTISTQQHPVHVYADSGTYLVTLFIENSYGCKNSIQKNVRIDPIFTIWIPNAFTPDGDDVNDYFTVKSYGVSQLEIKVFDKWGELLYNNDNMDDLEPKWDGTYKNKLLKNDVYAYKIKVKDVLGRWHEFIGRVTIIG